MMRWDLNWVGVGDDGGLRRWRGGVLGLRPEIRSSSSERSRRDEGSGVSSDERIESGVGRLDVRPHFRRASRETVAEFTGVDCVGG